LDIRQVWREFGVRYVLEGSVRHGEAIGFSQALVSLLIPLCTLAGCFQVLA
jgi:hypothetical protein